jgi:hypothetical protein
MPRCAAFVDALREAFGVAEINSVIKRGLRMECADGHRVWFSEAGHVLGRQAADAAPAISVADIVVGPVLHLPKARKSA